MSELGDLTAKGEATRAQLVTIAVDRFGRDGFQRSSMAGIARDAGLARSAPYAYFENKEDLFHAALDHDVAALVDEVVPVVLAEEGTDWPIRLVRALLDALADHPLAERVLAGLEPWVTGRVMDIPAFADLRAGVGALLAEGQAAGAVRRGLDAGLVGTGVIITIVSVLMSAVQLGPDTLDDDHLASVAALVSAALEPDD